MTALNTITNTLDQLNNNQLDIILQAARILASNAPEADQLRAAVSRLDQHPEALPEVLSILESCRTASPAAVV